VLCHLGNSGRRSKRQQCGGRLFTCGVTSLRFTGPNAWLLQALMKQTGVNKGKEWDVMSKNFSFNAVFDNGAIWLKDPSEPRRGDIAKFLARCRRQIFKVHSDGRCLYFQSHAGTRGRKPRDQNLTIDKARENVYAIPETAWKDGFELPRHVSVETPVPESVLNFSIPGQSNLTLLERTRTDEEVDPVSNIKPCGGHVFQCHWNDETLIPGYGILTQEHKDLVNIFLDWWEIKDSWQLINPSFTRRHGYNRYSILTATSDGARKIALFIGWCRYWIGQTHKFKSCSYFLANTRSAWGPTKAAAVGNKPKGSSPDSGLQVATNDVYKMRPKDWRDEKLHSKIAAHKKKYGFPSE
jgi:hypothetical protein